MIIFLGSDSAYKLFKPLIEESKDHKPNIVVSCQYNHKIPKSLIDSHICVNIHYGDLPRYAGCNPIFWQIIESDSAAATLHYVDEGFDSGDIIAKSNIPISRLNADELHEELERRGFILFNRLYKRILAGTAPRTKQDLSLRVYRSKNKVDFDLLNEVGSKDPKLIRALHFEGKQYPKMVIGDREYEIRSCDASI